MVSLAQMCTYAASGVKFQELCGGMSVVQCQRVRTNNRLAALNNRSGVRTCELAGLARGRDVDLVILGCLLRRPAKALSATQP